MRPLIILCCAVAVVGCAKKETPAADTAAVAPAPPPPPPPIKVSDVAGKWNVTGKTATGDTTLVTYLLTATPDSTMWTMQFTGKTARKDKIPVRVVSVAGDSIWIEAGPFPSVLRKGVKVKNAGALRLQNGKLVGTTTAHYSVKTADSVRKLVMEGTRAP
jgi:hypothetical protein